MPRNLKNTTTPKSAVHAVTEQAPASLAEAMALHRRGLLAEAQVVYEDILSARPEHFETVRLRGVLALQTGHHNLAAELIRRGISINPAHAGSYSNLGFALRKLKQLEAAVASYDRAVAATPDFAEAYYNCGIALMELNRPEAAIASYDRAIELKVGYAESYCDRGLALMELKQPKAAAASYEQAIAIKSDFPEAYYNRGIALEKLCRPQAAVASYGRAIAIRNDLAEAYSNRGNVLKELAQLDAAVASFDQAIAIRSAYAEAYVNRGMSLHDLRRLDSAIANYDRAIAVRPDFAEAHLNKSLALLLGGDFEAGWPLYEWRWDGSETSKRHKRNFSRPIWLGNEPLDGKTILLHCEQGFGDTIQFCRYVQLVAVLGARIILEVPEPLAGVLTPLDGVSELIVKGAPLPVFDYHCPLLTLPLAFKTRLTSIPSSNAYLSSNGDRVRAWTARLGRKTKPRVGIVWSGNDQHRNDRSRSIALSSLLQHLPDAFEYVSLQKEVRDIDRATLGAHGEVRHFGEALVDFSDTAALCELMDVVISVDTSVAHLSGALGRRTWVMLPYVPDWRWLLDRDDSPWYPSARLYRQDADRKWASVFERVRTDLIALIA